MKKWLVLCISTLALGLLPGCSTHWTEAEPGIDSDGLMSRLDEVEVEASGVGAAGDLQAFLTLAGEEMATIYFAEAPGTLGPIESVFSVFDFSFLGEEIFMEDIQEVEIYFVDLNSESHRDNGLLIRLVVADQPKYYVFMSTDDFPSQVANQQLLTSVTGERGQVVLRTYDLQDDEDTLMGVIQLKISYIDPEDGLEYGAGQFSTLVGFQ